MANPALLQKKKGKYLWFSLLGLGFQPDTAISSLAKVNINVKHIHLGPNMFDKPNKDASYIVIHFLLVKLNPTRFQETYRHCWPVLNHKADAEFRKVTCAWLKEIMDEIANAGSKVGASLFLSPGGPKFIGLMLQLANHVMLQEMKTFTTDGSWFPETASVPASSLDMATKRLNLTTKRFLKTSVDQDHFLQEYQRRAPLLVRSLRDLREESANYNESLKRYSSDSEQEQVCSAAEKIRKVRSLWSDIDWMLSTIKDEKNAMESVLLGDVDQYILDGTDRVLKVPRCLLERIERLPHQLSSGNMYETGQLNLLCVLELVTHALQILTDERRGVSIPTRSELSSQHLQEKCQQMACVLQDLYFIRQRIFKEEIPKVKKTLTDMEAEWDRKWMNTLKDAPLVSFLNEDPALGFLSPMAPLSFKRAAEATYRHCVFSKYPAKLLEKSAESQVQDVVNLNLSNHKRPVSARAESPGVTEVSSQANRSLDWFFDTPLTPPLSTPSVPSPQATVKKTPGRLQPKMASLRTKAQIIDIECDNLADQFADAVTTSPIEGRVKGLDLEGLLNTLQGDPFSTRKQLPRTPESLILDVKNSWRKAVKEDEAEKMRQAQKFDACTKQSFLSMGMSCNVSLSSGDPSKSVSDSIVPTVLSYNNSPVCQQGSSPRSTLLWDTTDSHSCTESSAVQFSLDHETLPEMPSCDSILSLDNEAVEMSEEEGEESKLLLPSLGSEVRQPRGSMASYVFDTQQLYDDGSFIDGKAGATECLLLGHDEDWLLQPVDSVKASEKVFTLDLDTLETPLSPNKQEYSLPKLISFSPIDDMKC
ncbi:HAUS augmin-like complex subunit 6 isoform X2 [Cynoglossus semilaevis]|uniref:HAUS augmin-like complex subunit 6 isoform X2 n=1 Tax=Cynoglossus semilaevis TaxID=244447 RepID=UPI0007DC9873|nr:HAUS augmin-like complex subunit 6 isoform X2 [Cynoglossus semilaevis]